MKRLKTAILFVISLLVTSPLAAETLFARCSLDKVDDYGLYVAVTVITQFDSDHYWEFLYINYDVDNGLFSDAEDADLSPSNPEVDYENGFLLPRTAGCATGHISAQGFRASDFYTSPQMCWSDAQCYLGVTIDPGGYFGGDTSGTYFCTDCITLSAFPLDGWDWVGWTGSITSDAPVITVCMQGAEYLFTAQG